MRKALILSLALFTLPLSAQTRSISNSDAQPAEETAAVAGDRAVTAPTINQPQVPAGEKQYDDFSGTYLDPAKWSPANLQCWGNVLECVCEIPIHKLRLAARSFGDRDSDSGQWERVRSLIHEAEAGQKHHCGCYCRLQRRWCPTNSTN